jgi:hypothetical protein
MNEQEQRVFDLALALLDAPLTPEEQALIEQAAAVEAA